MPRSGHLFGIFGRLRNKQLDILYTFVMEDVAPPTIKGLFVMSHIRALEERKGREGVVDLMTRYGKSIRFNLLEDVPVRKEVQIIEHVFDILTGRTLPPKERSFEAGKLHFENFSRTQLGSLLLPIFRTAPKIFLSTRTMSRDKFSKEFVFFRKTRVRGACASSWKIMIIPPSISQGSFMQRLCIAVSRDVSLPKGAWSDGSMT